MCDSQKEFLDRFGWDNFFESQISSRDLDVENSELIEANRPRVGRVICEEKSLYRVQISLDKSIWASVSGKLQFDASGRSDFPAVGDWVSVKVDGSSERGAILHMFSRKSVITRKQAGLKGDIQILSANVDWMFIATSARTDLNLRRLERYLSVARDSAVTPVILVTKADEAGDEIESLLANVRREFSGVEVFAVSQDQFASAQFFERYLKPGKTSIFVGSSGVGKSTLVNYLTNQTDIKTQAIRVGDGRGKHTTTSRNLYVSRFGGLVIDTPGIRELQLSDHGEGVQTQFADIEEWISQCRFSDCQHMTEPGCAIKSAIASEELSPERWLSYKKLEAEAEHARRRKDKALAAAERDVWKKRSQYAREASLDKKNPDKKKPDKKKP